MAGYLKLFDSNMSFGILKVDNSRLLIVARFFFVLAFVPVAAMFYEAWAFNVESGVEVGDRMGYYTVATTCFSIVSGVLYGVQRFRTLRAEQDSIPVK